MPTSNKDLQERILLTAAQDTFNRANLSGSSSIATGWGTASDGESWSTASGTGATYALSSNEGTITGTTNTIVVYLGAQTLYPVEALVRFSVTALSDEVSVLVMGNSGGSTYYRLRYKTSALNLIRVNSGTSTTLASASVSLTTGQFYWLRLRVTAGVGSVISLLGKYWAASSSEPTGFTLASTDTSGSALTSAGRFGMSCKLNTTGDTISFDSFQVQGGRVPSGRDLSSRFNMGYLGTHDLIQRERLAALNLQDLTSRLVFGYPTKARDLGTRIKPAPTLLKDLSSRLLPTASLGDTFQRANTSPTTSISAGWGTPSDGEAWTQASTGSVTYAITSNEGTVTGITSAVVAYLGSTALLSTECVVRFSVTSLTDEVAVVARGDGTAQNYYRVRYKTSALTLIRVNSGVGTTIASQNVSLTTGLFYWLRLRLVASSGGGVQALGKYWKDGTGEPTAWTLSTTDISASALLSTGRFGLYAKPNASTDTVSFDSFQATWPAPLSYWDLGARARLTPAVPKDITVRFVGAASPALDLTWRLVFGYPNPQKSLLTRARIAPSVLKDTSTRLFPASQLADSFVRANTTPSTQISAGWGTASDGEVWSQPTGSASSTYAIVSNAGTFTGTTTQTVMYLGSTTLSQAEGLVRFKATSSSDEVGMCLRGDTTGKTLYRFRYKSVAVNLIRSNNATLTTLGTATVSFSAGAFYWLRFRVVDSGGGSVLLLGKYWKDGTSEPTAWTLSFIDQGSGVLSSVGQMGLSVRLNASADIVTFETLTFTWPAPPKARDLSTRVVSKPSSAWDTATRAILYSSVDDWNLSTRVHLQSPQILHISILVTISAGNSNLLTDVARPVLDQLYLYGWNPAATVKLHSQSYVTGGGLWINWSPSINWSNYSSLFDVNYPLTIDSNALSHGQTTINNHDPQVCLDFMAAVARYKLAYPSDTRYDLPNANGYMGISQFIDHLTAQGTNASQGDFKPQLGASNYGGYSNPKGWVYFSLLNCYEAFGQSPLLSSQQVQNLLQSTLYAAWTYYNQWYQASTTINGVTYPINNIYNTGTSKLVTSTLAANVSAGGTTLTFPSTINSGLNAPVAGSLTISDGGNSETLTYYNLGPSATTANLASPLQFAHLAGVTVNIPLGQTTYTGSPSQNLLCAAALIDAAYRFPSQITTGMFYLASGASQSPALWIAAAQNVVASTLGIPPSSYSGAFNTTYGMFYTLMGANLGLAPDIPSNTQAKIENNGEVVEGLVRLAVLLKNGWYLDVAKRVIDSAFQYIWDSSQGGSGFFFDYDMGTQTLGNGYKETRSTALMLRGLHAYNQLSGAYTQKEQLVVSLLSNQYFLHWGSPGYTYRVTPGFQPFQNSYTPGWSSVLTQAAGTGSTALQTQSGSGQGLSGANVMVFLDPKTTNEELLDVVYPPQGTGPYTFSVTPAWNNGAGLVHSHPQGAVIEVPPPVNTELAYTTEAMGSTIEHLLFTLTPVDYPAGYGPVQNLKDVAGRVNLQLSSFTRLKDTSTRVILNAPHLVAHDLSMRTLLALPTYVTAKDLSARTLFEAMKNKDTGSRVNLGLGAQHDLSLRVYLATPAGGGVLFIAGLFSSVPNVPVLVPGSSLPLPFPPAVYAVNGVLLPDQPHVATTFSSSPGFVPAGSRLTLFFANASPSTQALLALGTMGTLTMATAERRIVQVPFQVTATSTGGGSYLQGTANYQARLTVTQDTIL